jgi:hypothetical protein
MWNSIEHLYFCLAMEVKVRPSAGHFRLAVIVNRPLGQKINKR